MPIDAFESEYIVAMEINPLKEEIMSPTTCRVLSTICFIAGFVSVLASIAIWVQAKEPIVDWAM